MAAAWLDHLLALLQEALARPRALAAASVAAAAGFVALRSIVCNVADDYHV